MSSLDRAPTEILCRGDARPDAGIRVLSGREVPLGGPRALVVHRTLPHRERSFIGAWCFVDHYGPAPVAETGGMDVPPHPHTGLQTVSWLFEGEIEHRDSGGVRAVVRPGEVNLMTGGAGICHSEVSTPSTTVLHGVQLWVALPDDARHAPRAFAHHAPERVEFDGGVARVFLGGLLGSVSPVPTHSPLLGAELVLAAGADVTLDVDAAFEHGVLVDSGVVEFDGTPLSARDLGCRDAGSDTLRLRVRGGPARVVLLGGTPFGEEILMWWNFVGRDHAEIETFRAEWEAHGGRFGEVEGYTGAVPRLPAPPLPGVRLRTRGNR